MVGSVGMGSFSGSTEGGSGCRRDSITGGGVWDVIRDAERASEKASSVLEEVSSPWVGRGAWNVLRREVGVLVLDARRSWKERRTVPGDGVVWESRKPRGGLGGCLATMSRDGREGGTRKFCQELFGFLGRGKGT